MSNGICRGAQGSVTIERSKDARGRVRSSRRPSPDARHLSAGPIYGLHPVSLVHGCTAARALDKDSQSATVLVVGMCLDDTLILRKGLSNF